MNQPLTSDQIQSILQGVAIPPQPQIMVDLHMEQISPNSSMERITNLICQDVGLSGSILKTVNSEFFGHSNRISSITQAINLLGASSVINIVNALSIRGELSDNDIISLGRFWDSAMEVAMAAAAIAKNIGFPYSDEAYTLGLFHNCAVPLLMARFKNYADVLRQTYADEEISISDAENALLQTNHAVVGYYVGKSWKLPEYLCQAIHEHHRIDTHFPGNNPDPKKSTLLAILKMSEHCCALYNTIGEQEIDHEWERIEDAVLNYVGLSQIDFLNLQEQISEMGIGGEYIIGQ